MAFLQLQSWTDPAGQKPVGRLFERERKREIVSPLGIDRCFCQLQALYQRRERLRCLSFADSVAFLVFIRHEPECIFIRGVIRKLCTIYGTYGGRLQCFEKISLFKNSTNSHEV